jgi:hypothetical protein
MSGTGKGTATTADSMALGNPQVTDRRRALGPIDFDASTAKLLGTACNWAADNAEGDTWIIAHYPLICLEVLKENKSWEQLEDEARNSYLESLSLPDRASYWEKFSTAVGLMKSDNAAERTAGEAQFESMARLVYDHYSKTLYRKLSGKDPETHVWNDFEIGLATPDNLPEATAQRLLKLFDDDRRIKQVQ